MSMMVAPGRFGVAGPVATPHRYWRIWIGSNSKNDLVTTISEIELRESAGGADVTGSGTASSDSNFAGSAASNAVANDGATTSWSSANSAYPHWWAYDFGSGVTKAIVEVAIQPPGSPDHPQAPGQFKVQSSDDGAAWADEWWVVYGDPTVSNTHGYAPGSFKVFTKPATEQSPVASRHLYFRLSITGANGSNTYVGAREILLKTIVGSVDETQSGTPTSRSNFSGLPPSQAFDGMQATANSTEWASNNVGFPEWIQYQFTEPKMIAEVTYQPRSGNETTQSPTAIDFQISDNGLSWTTVKSVSGLSWSSPAKVWTIP